jgi:hypothetical protein
MKSQHSVVLLVLGIGFSIMPFTPIARADHLELRNGQILQGKFLGGSPLNIRFQVDGKEQIFSTRDVLNIGLDEVAPEVQTSASGISASPSSPTPASSTDTPADTNSRSGVPTSASMTNAITVPSGTPVLVRMIDSVDSSQNKVGDSFHASLESALVIGDKTIAPKGADVYGKLTQAKEAGKISGAANLTLELTGIRINGNIVPVDSSDYDVAGKGRGKQSGERIGGGAALGAIIGGITGGGKGAAIGAGVGAGAGTGVQLATHGDKIRIPSETLLEFKLQQAVTVPLSQ